ncbi:MAG TPA: hypothetical protein GXZ55_06465 [Natronincola sp.]|nr:hypothetical protein [Natronincola sp.]
MNRGVKTFILLATFFVVTGSVAIIMVLPTLVTGSLISGHVQFDEVFEAADYGIEGRRVSLTTEDDHRLAAWEANTDNPKGVLMFFGGLNYPSVTAFWGHARLFAEHGYASLLVELRAHGESSGDQISLGYAEHLDVLAGLNHIRDREEYKDLPVIAYGANLGGVAAINAAGLYPELDGVISIAAFSSWSDLFRDNLYFSGAPFLLALAEKPFVNLYVLNKFGYKNKNIYPQYQIANLGDRPALLMHSEDDENVSFLNLERIMQRAPEQVEMWAREGSEHLVSTDFLYPENDPEYVERVLEFLTTNF